MNDETKILTETETFFQDQNLWNRNFFSKTKFSETETGHRSQSKPIGYFSNHGITKEQMKIEEKKSSTLNPQIYFAEAKVLKKESKLDPFVAYEKHC